MRRITSIILALMILTITVNGCDNATEKERVDKDVANETVDNLKKVEYKSDQILFVARNRNDIEGDQFTVYSYNYKGELLDSNDSSVVIFGYYSENGLAPAMDRNTGKYGFADKSGNFVIEPIYKSVSPFSENGMAVVTNGDYKSGYINSKGEEIIPLIYDYAGRFREYGYAITIKESGDKCNIIDEEGNIVTELEHLYDITKDYLLVDDGEKMIVYDYNNNELFSMKSCDVQSEQYEIIYVVEGEIIKGTFERREGGHYLVKEEKFNGKKFVEIKKNYEISSKYVATTKNGIGYGIVQDGEEVIPFEYDVLLEYGGFFVGIKMSGEEYEKKTIDIYDKKFKKTAENVEYTFCAEAMGYSSLPDGYFFIVRRIDSDEDSQIGYGIMDYTGNVIIEPVFDMSDIGFYSCDDICF